MNRTPRPPERIAGPWLRLEVQIGGEAIVLPKTSASVNALENIPMRDGRAV